MGNKSFAAEVEEAYAALRKLVMENQDSGLNQEFIDAITLERYTPPASITDPVTIHFLIISSHEYWEALYQHHVPGRRDKIGDFCRRLESRGRSKYSWTYEELCAIRREILFGDQGYSNFIADFDDDTKRYQETHSYSSLLHLFGITLMYGHMQKAKDYLQQIRECRGQESYADIDYLILAQSLYQRLGISEADLDEVKRILEGFAQYDMINRMTAQYDPIVYLRVWVDMIFYYLSALENIRMEQPSHPQSLPEAMAKILGQDHSIVVSFDPDFVRSASDIELELMKKHDELLLQLVQYIPDDYFAPIFKGTDFLLFYARLNLSFPDKLQFILSSGLPCASCKHPYKMTEEKLMQRLLVEFPDKEAEIREALFPFEDSEEDAEESAAL